MYSYQSGFLILLFVAVSLLVGGLVKHILKNSKVPYSVALLVVGLFAGFVVNHKLLFADHKIIYSTLQLIAEIDPHLILYVFLPTLIFESAFCLEVYLFRRLLSQILLLAVPGLIISTILTAIIVKFILPWQWGWPICFMFGALISATDPVAVVSLLKEISSRKRLETLIEGESLLNDGTAIVLFSIFLKMALVTGTSELQFVTVISEFCRVVVLGFAVGWILGRVAVFWVGRVFNDPLIEITITIATTYIAFMVAEHWLHASGVVSIVTVALLFAGIGRTRVSPEVISFLHRFWETVAFIANTIIFLLVGVIISYKVNLQSQQAWLMLAIIYMVVIVIRAFTVTLFTPILKKISIGFNKEKAIVVIWGGLRGAISLSLALVVVQHQKLSGVGEQILFLCAGIVVLTMGINGTTMLPVLRYTKLDKLPKGKEVTVQRAKRKIAQVLAAFSQELQRNEFLKFANWQKINKYIQYKEGSISEEADIDVQDQDIACMRRLLESERKDYWHQFSEGLISKAATHKLVDAVEHALDGAPTILRPVLHKYWLVPRFINICHNIPGLKRIAFKLAINRLFVAYDIARGFIHAQEHIAGNVQTLAPSEQLRDILEQEILQNKREAYSHIEQLRDTFPEVLTSLETYVAKKTLLHKEHITIENLGDTGVLDAPEVKKLIADVELKMQQQKLATKNIVQYNKLDLLTKVPLLENMAGTSIKALAAALEERLYGAGDIIVSQGHNVPSLGIVIRGTVEVMVRIKEEGKTKHDFFGSGTVFGASEVLANKTDATINAITPVEVFWVKSAVITRLCQTDQLFAKNLSAYIPWNGKI